MKSLVDKHRRRFLRPNAIEDAVFLVGVVVGEDPAHCSRAFNRHLTPVVNCTRVNDVVVVDIRMLHIFSE